MCPLDLFLAPDVSVQKCASYPPQKIIDYLVSLDYYVRNDEIV